MISALFIEGYFSTYGTNPYKYTVIYFETKSAPPEIKLRPKKHIISGPSEMKQPTRKLKPRRQKHIYILRIKTVKTYKKT